VLLLAVWLPAFAVPTHGPGLHQTPLILDDETDSAGLLEVYNSRGEFIADVAIDGGWLIHELQLYVEPYTGDPLAVPEKKGNIDLSNFPHKREFDNPPATTSMVIPFAELFDGGFQWGEPYEHKRTIAIVLHADLVMLDADGLEIAKTDAWAFGEVEVPYSNNGTAFVYQMAHPDMAHFVDSAVGGLNVISPTFIGKTDASGGFTYFPGERAEFSIGDYPIGSTLADHRVTPLDIFEQSDSSDARVINMARLLQSLDAEASPQDRIAITAEVETCLNGAMQSLGLGGFDFSDSNEIDAIIDGTIAQCAGTVALVSVSAEDAKENLDKTLNNTMFRKNVSKTPALGTAKSKLDLMPILVPATKANGDAVIVEYFGEDGSLLYTRNFVHPLVSVYADQIPETGAHDTWGAISRDDGASWKRMNLSRAADRSSFDLANGQPYYGDVKKPNLAVKGNYILAVWQSKFCRGGKPRYSLEEFLDDGITPNPYYVDDIYGVGGPQRSHDYTEDGFPEVGELPFYCLWLARGTVDPLTGDISWRKPERLTSGRRDVWQIAVNGAKDVGFGIVWQEDPEGVRPGEMAGPGHGWSGATTNHKTDIWYSYITWADFAAIDESFTPNGDPEHAFDDPEWTTNRPMPLVPFSMPMRLSDNDVCNTDNMMVELGADGLPALEGGDYTPLMDEEGKHAGTHRYCYLLDNNANDTPDLCASFYEFVNEQGATKNVCVTEDGRLLDGDTGASRPNVSFMPYQKTLANGTKVASAWVAIVYEETKGVGGGAPDHTGEPPYGGLDEKPDSGKNVIYHSFEFGSPSRVSGGDIVNLPARDVDENLLYLVDYETGERVLDYLGNPQLAYENARRPRMLVQPAGSAGSSGTVMVLVYKQGEEGKGRQSDIMLRRVNKNLHAGNPYAFWNFACNETALADNGQTVCVDGAQNLSSVTPVEYWTNPDQDDQAKGEGVKVVKYEQTAYNLADASWTNPYEDARAHRGVLRGNNVFLAYDYTPNWAAARNAHDKFDLFIRRSFDGGVTWTTDPLGADDVCHTYVWKDYNNVISEDDANQKATYEETACFEPGTFEPARNMSQLKNNKLSVIEPRLVGTPGTTPDSPYSEDITNGNVFWVTFGTATNVPKAHGSEEEEEESAVPADLYYTFTRDRGQTFFKRLWFVNPESDGNNAGLTVERWDYLAKGDPEQGEAQIRMTPDGSRFYAVWNQEGVDGSDTWFRRIVPREFPIPTSTE
jgi:hypothetical protein